MNAADIVRKLSEMDPYSAGERGDLSCFFCSAMDSEPHEKDCIWLTAKTVKVSTEKGARFPPRSGRAPLTKGGKLGPIRKW